MACEWCLREIVVLLMKLPTLVEHTVCLTLSNIGTRFVDNRNFAIFENSNETWSLLKRSLRILASQLLIFLCSTFNDLMFAFCNTEIWKVKSIFFNSYWSAVTTASDFPKGCSCATLSIDGADKMQRQCLRMERNVGVYWVDWRKVLALGLTLSTPKCISNVWFACEN